ncbi:hypothetical protein FQR65_LT01954 [Abscondita terminalis]|nr:hypothetical protein FQR65_LT01954 [Abscondita terminalis]
MPDTPARPSSSTKSFVAPAPLTQSHVLERGSSLQADESFTVFGKHVANKLLTVSHVQNMFAQKLIKDALFEAEMLSLTRHFKVVHSTQHQHDVYTTRDRYSCQQNISPKIGQYHIPQSQQQEQHVPRHVGQD